MQFLVGIAACLLFSSGRSIAGWLESLFKAREFVRFSIDKYAATFLRVSILQVALALSFASLFGWSLIVTAAMGFLLDVALHAVKQF